MEARSPIPWEYSFEVRKPPLKCVEFEDSFSKDANL